MIQLKFGAVTASGSSAAFGFGATFKNFLPQKCIAEDLIFWSFCIKTKGHKMQMRANFLILNRNFRGGFKLDELYDSCRQYRRLKPTAQSVQKNRRLKSLIFTDLPEKT